MRRQGLTPIPSRPVAGLAVAGVLLLGAVVASGDPAVVRVDHVQVLGGGRHEAWVSVLDPQGGPVPGLTQSSFRVQEDRRPVPLREVQSYVEIHPQSRWAILVDSELLERPERQDLPVIDDRDPVAQLLGLVHVVRGVQHGRA